MKYSIYTAVHVIEADNRLEAVDKFCNSQVVIMLEETDEQNDVRAHEFVRRLNGCDGTSDSS